MVLIYWYCLSRKVNTCSGVCLLLYWSCKTPLQYEQYAFSYLDTYFLYAPRFFPAPTTFSTSQLVDAIAADGRVADSDPFGSASLLISFKYRPMDMFPTATEITGWQQLDHVDVHYFVHTRDNPHVLCLLYVRNRSKHSLEKLYFCTFSVYNKWKKGELRYSIL